jgi:hypothetical protein
MTAVFRLACVAAASLAGCAQMQVTKVSAEKRAHDGDKHVKGFRYYLARPYVLVKNKITVSAETSLLVFPAGEVEKGLDRLLASADAAPLAVFNPRSGALDRVSEEQWGAMRALLAQAAAAAPAGPSVSLGAGSAARDLVGAVPPAAPAAPAAAPRGSVAFAPLPGRPVADQGVGVTLGETPDGASLDAETGTEQGAKGSRSRGSPSSGPLGAQKPPPDDHFKTVDLKGNIDIVFLPDLDEQYAVNNQNFLSKSSYALTFRDGWQLVGVNGEFDSTPVAIALLQTIDGAISTAQGVATTALDTASKLAAARRKTRDLLRPDTADEKKRQYLVLEVRRERVIPPGLYRINKPWETDKASAPTGHGLLAKLGLTTVEVVSVVQAEVTGKP